MVLFWAIVNYASPFSEIDAGVLLLCAKIFYLLFKVKGVVGSKYNLDCSNSLGIALVN